MDQIDTEILREKTLFEINLSLKEIFGAIIAILGYIVLVISAKQDIGELLQNRSRTEILNAPSPAPNPTVDRLRERRINIQAGLSTDPIAPNVKIALGSVLSAFGNTLESIGTQDVAALPTARITIV